MPEPTPIALLITAGRTDLKFIITRENGPSELADVGNKSCRAVHRWLLENPTRWAVVAPAEGLKFDVESKDEEERKLPFVDYDAKAAEGLPLRLAKPGGGFLEREGCLQLAAPKLSAILHALDESAKTGKIRWVGGLVLYTDRATHHRRSNEEPIAIGGILAQWIGENTGLEVSAVQNLENPAPETGKLGYYSFLTGAENWDAPDGNLYGKMKTRLETAVRQIADWECKPWLMLATAGGFPEVKAYLAVLAEVHFQDRWRPLKNPEQASQPLVPEPSAGARYVGDTEAVQARANALRLLKKWDIHGACAAAAHLPDKRSGVWRKVLIRLDQFRSGLGADKSKDEAFSAALNTLMVNPLAWKVKQPGHNDKMVEVDAPLRLIVVGFRAESSLREGRILDALSQTYTFYNVMVWDLVEHLARTKFCAAKSVQFKMIDDSNIQFSGGYPTISHGLKENIYDKDFWFDNSNSSSSVLVNDNFPFVKPEKAFIQLKDLLGEYAQWTSAFDGIVKCKHLRHKYIHKILTPTEVLDIRNKLCSAGAWEKSGNAWTVVGTQAAQGCLASFYGEGQGDELLKRIEAVHTAALATLLKGE